MKRSPEAWRSADLFDSGYGSLVVSRFKADGRVEAGLFLLDVFCLGVKEAGFHHFSSVADYQEGLIDRLFPDGYPVRMTPEAARKLTEGAISYAKGLGFSPAADYKKASRVFGGITTANCDEQFVFGKNGKPLYAQGLLESPACVEKILRVLEARCGEGGYDYILADNFELFDGEDENVQDPDTDPIFRAGLERMADGLRAAQPGVAVQINPPGRQKVSDIICQIAEPLLESASDYKSKEMIIQLTTLAWNFTLRDPIQQEAILAEVADQFPGPEDLDMFYFLAVRKAFLFPKEDRLICHVEMEPAVDNDIELRVASAM